MRSVIMTLSAGLAILAAACDGNKGDTKPAKVSTAKLEIKDIKEGTGPEAKVGDLVEVHYTGRLDDGTVFDSSRGKNPYPVRLGDGAVIPGWEQGLLGMKVGGQRQLTIPPELAYGAKGRPGIPPNAYLFFDVELASLKSQ